MPDNIFLAVSAKPEEIKWVVSKEAYDKVVAERDALREQLKGDALWKLAMEYKAELEDLKTSRDRPTQTP